jgi:ABC-type Zn uptake system ZnuABC Zn-binding protein ZnuA
MKRILITKLVLISIIFLAACGKSNQHEHHEQDDMAKDDPNQALYDEVMAVHNEVMPKTGEIYQLKKELKDKIAAEPDQKEELEKIVAELDSADHSMMDWMHKFNEPDSVTQEVAREYLENEMEKINKVKELINTSVQKAKDKLGKK